MLILSLFAGQNALKCGIFLTLEFIWFKLITIVILLKSFSEGFMTKKNVTIHTAESTIEGFLSIPKSNDLLPAIIFANGYCAYHEMYDHMADAFNKAGFVTLQYEPRGSAGSRHGFQLCGTEWLDDITAAISYVCGLEEVDSDRVGLAGVSMGGAMTVIQAARDKRIKAVYIMAPYINGELNFRNCFIENSGQKAWDSFLTMMERNASAVAQGCPSEYVPENMSCFSGLFGEPSADELEARRLHPLKITRLPLESVYNVYLHVDALAEAGKLTVPALLVHGTGDTTLDYKNSHILFDALGSQIKKFELIPDAEHVLPEVEPELITNMGLDWFIEYL